jgi:hypothetical protein
MNGVASNHFKRRATQPDQDLLKRMNNLLYLGYEEPAFEWSNCDKQMLYDGKGQATISG